MFMVDCTFPHHRVGKEGSREGPFLLPTFNVMSKEIPGDRRRGGSFGLGRAVLPPREPQEPGVMGGESGRNLSLAGRSPVSWTGRMPLFQPL